MGREDMNAGEVVVTIEDGIAVLRLSHPARRNAISMPMWRSLAGFAAQAAARSDIRAVLIRGEGEVAFSSGADIGDFKGERTDASNSRGYDDVVEETCRAIENIPQPSLALIKGACIGAGASLAASCDLRLAQEGAFFAVPAARLGLGYDSRGIARFLRVFGNSATRALLFTAQALPAIRAHALGAVHAMVSSEESEAAAHALLDRMAANAPLTIRAAKLAIRALSAGDKDLLAEADKLAAAADASADYAEGRSAFAEKRTPRFKGS